MRSSQDLMLAAGIIAVGSFHLIYGYRTGKIVMGVTWRIARADNPIMFWILMIVSALVLAAGLYLGIVGLPPRAGL
jgi:hypothetical protein